MRDRRSSSCPVAALAAATVLGLGLLTLELPAQGSAAAVSSVFTNALAERDSLSPAEGSLWRFEGPRNLMKGSHYMGKSPYSGRINEVAIHPHDPQIMYATGATGGVWKTTDRGLQWVALGDSDWPIQSATAVAIDPTDPNRVFVGTGDYKRLDHVPPFSVGIMRSLDGGLTWGAVGTTEMREFTVSRIVIDPANSQNIFAATGRGSRLPGGRIFRSTDGGATWAVTPDPPQANWDDLESCQGVFWASGTRRLSVDDSSGAEPGLLYKSSNGVDWTEETVAAGAFPSSAHTIQIACGNTSVGHVVFIAVFRENQARVYALRDGAPWQQVTATPVATGGGEWAHSGFALTTNRLYLGGTIIYAAALPPPGQPQIGTLTFSQSVGESGRKVHNDMQCVVPDRTEVDAVFVCTDGGLYHFSAQSNTVTPLNATLGVTQVYRMDVHPRHGGLVAIGAQDLGNSVSFFGNGTDSAALGQPPNWSLVIGGDGRSAAFKGDHSSHVYLANTAGQVSRYDGTLIGQSGQTDLQTGLWPDNTQGPLLYRPSIDALDYAATSFHELVFPDTRDATTADWTTIAFPSDVTIQSLAACPTNAEILYAGTQHGKIFYSDNGGMIGSWIPATQSGLPQNASGTPLPIPIWTISPSPGNCHDVIVGMGYEGQLVPKPMNPVRNGSNTFHAGDRLFRNADVLGGGAWSGLHGGPQALPHAPVFAIVRHPAAPASRWFVAGDVGVFRTDNGGASWTNATAPLGLPNTLVRDLRLSADGNTLYAGTFGRGVWSMDVSRPAADVFSIRGRVTVDGRPRSGEVVVAEGPGRIRKWLSNTLTTGVVATTAVIAVGESATIAGATVFLSGRHLASVKLVTPDLTELSMTQTSPSGPVSTYSLTASSAATLVGQQTRGSWSFKVTGTVGYASGTFFTNDPSVTSAQVDFQFTDGVSNTTAPDGEYTIEYLRTGAHVVSIPGCAVCLPASVDLTSHQTSVDFEPNAAFIVASAPNASEAGTFGRFTVSRNGSTANALTVHYTIGGTAAAGSDYQSLNSSVTIPAGSPDALIQVTPLNDALDEDPETVILEVVPAAGYSVGQQSTAVVQVLDDDPLPTLSINNVMVNQGGTAVFTVTLSPASGRLVTVNYATANGTAISGTCPFGDYLTRMGSLTFVAGAISRPISVPICGAWKPEGNETFVVQLYDQFNAGIATSTGTATIRP